MERHKQCKCALMLDSAIEYMRATRVPKVLSTNLSVHCLYRKETSLRMHLQKIGEKA